MSCKPTSRGALFISIVALLNAPSGFAEDAVQKGYDLMQQAKKACDAKEYDKEIAILKQSLLYSPDRHWVHLELGVRQSQGKSQAEGLVNLQRAYELKPDDRCTVENLTYFLEKMARSDTNIEVCSKYLTKHKDDNDTVQIRRRLAHALAERKRYAESYAEYNRLLAIEPQDQDLWYAACYDFDCEPAAKYFCAVADAYTKKFPKGKSVPYFAYKSRKLAMQARAANSAAQKDAFDAFITLSDPKKSPVSTDFYGMVKEGLRAIPANIWQPLAKYGCKVVLCRYVTDVDGTGKERHPRGWKPGATFSNTDGVYLTDKKYITIAEFILDDQKRPVKYPDPAHTVGHEVGHAYDFYLGSQLKTHEKYARFSHGKIVSAAYAADVANLSPTTKERLKFYLQSEDKAGQEELFAELIAIIFVKTNLPGSTDDLLTRAFPTVVNEIRRALDVDPSGSVAKPLEIR